MICVVYKDPRQSDAVQCRRDAASHAVYFTQENYVMQAVLHSQACVGSGPEYIMYINITVNLSASKG